MKTGTTYLQGVLAANRDALAGTGLHFAGSTWSRQVRAAQDLLGLDQHDPQIASLSAGAWDELVAEIHGRRDGATVVSMEFLSFARRQAISRVVRDLAGVEVHVVITVRDVTATIPAQWQTSVTSASTHPWSEFQAGVVRAGGLLWAAHALRGDTGVREFRRTQDVAHMLRTWGRLVPPERLHVVTVPLTRRDPDELWRRFAVAIGADPALATEPAQDSNPSLGHASTELVRRLNVALVDTLPWDYNRTVKVPLAAKVLAARRRQEGRPRLDASTAAFAARWNQTTREAVTAAGVHVVGTLDDLPAEAHPPTAAAGDADPAPADVLGAARDAWAGLVPLVDRRRRRVARLTGRPRPERWEAPVPAWLDGPGGSSDLDRAVDDLTRLVRDLMRLRREALGLGLTSDDPDDADDDSPLER